ncbi:UNVERIFIED_CONTAM: hypothetical protein FKN15_004308 [Acipenser sinensis]
MSAKTGIQILSRLPLLLTHEGVLLPGCTMRISVDTYRNMQLVKSRLLWGTSLKSTIIGVIANTRDPEHDTDELPALYRVGTAGIAVGSNWLKPHYTLLITELCPFRTLQLLKQRPFAVGKVEQLDQLEQHASQALLEGELGELGEQILTHTHTGHIHFTYCCSAVSHSWWTLSVPVVAKLWHLLDSLPKETLPDMLASMIRETAVQIPCNSRHCVCGCGCPPILDALGLEERFKKLSPLLTQQIEGLKLLQKTRKPRQDEDKTVVAIRPVCKIGHFPGGQFSLDTAEEEEEEDSNDISLLEKMIRSTSMPELALKVVHCECTPHAVSSTECTPYAVSFTEWTPHAVSFTECTPHAVSFTEWTPHAVSFTECTPHAVSFTEWTPHALSSTECTPHAVSSTECTPHAVSFTEWTPHAVSSTECTPHGMSVMA